MTFETSENSITIKTPAKLNLFLEVLGKRDDGFHELETVIIAINRFDVLQISKSETPGIELSCRWAREMTQSEAFPSASADGFFGDLPNDSNNLVYRAAELFLSQRGLSSGLEIDLEKSIPSQAGLGGASGNAAGTLVALNELFSVNLPAKELVELASQLGSDVPFFVEGGYALCSGRGEKITQLNIDPDLSFVVVKPPFGLSTKDIFSKLALPANVKSIETGQLEQNRVDWTTSLFNRLQEPAVKVSPEIGKICDFLNRSGCLASQMTGSGSCCFGICKNKEHARQIERRISEERIGFAFVCENLPYFSVRM